MKVIPSGIRDIYVFFSFTDDSSNIQVFFEVKIKKNMNQNHKINLYFYLFIVKFPENKIIVFLLFKGEHFVFKAFYTVFFNQKNTNFYVFSEFLWDGVINYQFILFKLVSIEYLLLKVNTIRYYQTKKKNRKNIIL